VQAAGVNWCSAAALMRDAEIEVSIGGLKLDDEDVKVPVGLRLGLNLCVPHQCRCGAPVDASGLHSFVYKQAPGKAARHHALNDVVIIIIIIIIIIRREIRCCLGHLLVLITRGDRWSSGRMSE